MRYRQYRYDPRTITGLDPDWLRKLDSRRVESYCQRIKQGKYLPPIVVTKGREIVSGRHRLRAHLIRESREIDVIIIDYATAAEREEDAILENLDRGHMSAPERKKAVARLYALRKQHHEEEQRGESDQKVSRSASETPRQKALDDVAVAADIGTRHVARIVAEVTAPPPEEHPPGESELIAAVETDHRKRRSRALKRMAELLRKVGDCVSDLEGIGNGAMARITVAVTEAQQAVWDASVAEGKAPEEDEPDAHSPDGACLLDDCKAHVTPSSKPSKKRIKVELPDGQRYVEPDDSEDIPF